MSAEQDSDEAWLAKVTSQYTGDHQIDEGPVDLDNSSSDLLDGGVDARYETGTHETFDGLDEDRTEIVDPAAVFPDESGSVHPPAARRFDHKVAAGFGAVAAAGAVVALVAGVMFYSGGAEQATVPSASIADPSVAVAVAKPATTPAPAPDADREIPYIADASGSCPAAGSTPAQTMAGNDPRNAFVCVRGGANGQIITIDLSKTYIITAIKITPGWVGKDDSDVSQWSQHRVVSTVQYSFNDVDRTFITQDTHNVHGEAVVKVKRVLASKITMLILQTSRPPTQPQNSRAPQQGEDGLLPGLFGTDAPAPPPVSNPFALAGQPANSDPVDAKFAISRLRIIGHEPT
ncbi:hypothetical protein KL864_25520 [Mycolicibacterium goodii]|uniref:hypothetical protein n=1 Tax=Mycolicibacterium goodii TaxID=134601 RepID=UPI001BDC11CE|nr:hypothetical protein [Mycolicibacterium goodii]MBU8819258.1 hypothetical protein [Mycolicibacterium goodii]